MNGRSMGTRSSGHYEPIKVGEEAVQAFVPAPLPPAKPPLRIDGQLLDRLTSAEAALRKLVIAGEMIPSLDWFVYAFVRKEAVISSQIEGTQATLLDLLAFEADDDATPSPDVEEVTSYLRALNYARAETASKRGLPLSMRLLNQAHRHLMAGGRGGRAQPGEVRQGQNWIGGSRASNAVFIPPPADKLRKLLGDLEKYMHAEDELPKLVRAGLIHVQFETIHPYLDGNGRIGRLLIALLLEHWGLVPAPLLYLSLFFKRHRAEYYRRLNAVRLEGDWEGWTDFFLDGIAVIAKEAAASARELSTLITADRERLLSWSKSSLPALRLFEQLPRHPIVTVASAMKLLDMTKPTASRAVKILVEAGILSETTGRKRDRSFAYRNDLARLQAGTELGSEQ